jgi:hypothetical protein
MLLPELQYFSLRLSSTDLKPHIAAFDHVLPHNFDEPKVLGGYVLRIFAHFGNFSELRIFAHIVQFSEKYHQNNMLRVKVFGHPRFWTP